MAFIFLIAGVGRYQYAIVVIKFTSFTEGVKMEAGSIDYHKTYIRTQTYERVLKHLETGQRSLFVSGLGGSGKTTLLKMLEQTWKERLYPYAFISLWDVSSEKDLFLKVSQAFNSSKGYIFEKFDSIVEASGHSIQRAVLNRLRQLPEQTLILLDGVDQISDPYALFLFLKLLREETNVKYIVTGRDSNGLRDSRRLFEVFENMDPLSLVDIKFMVENSSNAKISEKVLQQLYEATNGSPLSTNILLSMAKEGDLEKVLNNLKQPSEKTEAIFSSFVDRIFKKLEPIADESQIMRLLNALILLKKFSYFDLTPDDQKIAHELTLLGVLAENGESIQFAHPLLLQYFSKQFSTIQSEVNLSKLTFGAEEAERDILLEEAFQELPGLDELLTGSKNIVVGDRGAGKSAIFSQLPKLTDLHSQSQRVKIIPIKHPANLLKNLETNGTALQTAEHFRAGWLTLVAYAIAKEIDKFKSPQLNKTAKQIIKIMGDEINENSFIPTALRRMLSSSIKVKIGPVTIEPKPSDTVGKSKKTIDLNKFIFEAVKVFIKRGFNISVCFDRIDEVHKYDRSIQEKAIQGLFLAESELSQVNNLSVLIFIRTDLFEIYDIQEKNKLVTRTFYLRWQREELLDFILTRVINSRNMRDLSELMECFPQFHKQLGISAIFPEDIENLPVENWLWSSMANGNDDVSPRQVLLLLELTTQHQKVRDTSDQKKTVFDQPSLLKGMEELSVLCFKELIDDFRVGKTFLENCRAGRMHSFGLEKAKKLFSEKDGPISQQTHQLERLGFLERVVVENDNGEQVTEFRVPILFTRGWK